MLKYIWQYLCNNTYQTMSQSEPVLHFIGNIRHDFVFDAKFESNKSCVKSPVGTTHHLYQGDMIKIQSSAFSKCKAILRYKNVPNDIDIVETNFYNVICGQIEKSSCNLQIPKSGSNRRVTGVSPSRVAYINIVDELGQLVCQSNNFWIRSRSRSQIEKDTQNKKRPVQQSDSLSTSSKETVDVVPPKKTKVAATSTSTSFAGIDPARSNPVPAVQSYQCELPPISEIFLDKNELHVHQKNDSNASESCTDIYVLHNLVVHYKNQCDSMKKILDDHKKILDNNTKIMADVITLISSLDTKPKI